MHGCADGFSRRLLWLEVGSTNKNSEVIAKFYLDTVKQLGGIPRKIRSDDGTEKSVIEVLHTFLRSSHADKNAGPKCFNIGRSTANQRIESYGSQFVRDGPGWWINFFKDLSDIGLLRCKWRSQYVWVHNLTRFLRVLIMINIIKGPLQGFCC